MKLNKINKGIYYSLFLFVLSSAGQAYAHARPVCCDPGRLYVGAFGGVAWTRDFNISQFGSAFFTEAQGGALAVNAFGRSSNENQGFWGAHIGYRMPEIVIDPCCQWWITPGVELEGYYLGDNSFKALLINEESTRLDEHDFSTRFSLSRSVFLTNAIINFNIPCLCNFHPYIGAGIGGSVSYLSGARSIQIAPPEPGVNHFNAKTNDYDSSFAGQIKLGLSYEFNKCISVFAEYRWLYLASNHYTLGSTISPGHAQTSPWLVKFNPQYHNMAAVGINYTI